MFNWNANYKRVPWCLLSVILFLLSGCHTDSVFDGSRVSKASEFQIDYSVLDREETEDLVLYARDQLHITLSHTKGYVDVTVGMEGKEPIYRGNGQQNADFVLEIAETGNYHISVSGHQARGNISFTRIPGGT
jgi:hypothetical protein